MPIYDYACEKCRSEFEVEQRITEDPIKTCPKCRSRKVKRLISRTSFHLKGGGWHADLYSSAGDKKPEKSEGADAKPDATPDTKTDSKPEPKDKKKKKAKGSKAAA